LGRLAYVLGPRRSARDHLADAWAGLGLPADDALEPADLPAEVRALAGRVAAMLATTSVDRADGDAAIVWARRAIALDPDRAALASGGHMLAAGWALTGRMDEGLAELDVLCAEVARSRRAAPAVVDAHTARGLLRLWRHDLEAAAEDLEAAL